MTVARHYEVLSMGIDEVSLLPVVTGLVVTYVADEGSYLIPLDVRDPLPLVHIAQEGMSGCNPDDLPRVNTTPKRRDGWRRATEAVTPLPFSRTPEAMTAEDRHALQELVKELHRER